MNRQEIYKEIEKWVKADKDKRSSVTFLVEEAEERLDVSTAIGGNVDNFKTVLYSVMCQQPVIGGVIVDVVNQYEKRNA